MLIITIIVTMIIVIINHKKSHILRLPVSPADFSGRYSESVHINLIPGEVWKSYCIEKQCKEDTFGVMAWASDFVIIINSTVIQFNCLLNTNGALIQALGG